MKTKRVRYWGGVLALLPTVALGFRLQDPAGQPVVGARVEVVWLGGEGVLDRLTPAGRAAWSDAGGEVLLVLPRVRGAVVWVDHPEFPPRSWSLETELPSPLVLPQELWQGRVQPPPGEAGGRLCARGDMALPDGPRPVERCAPIAPDGSVTLPKLSGPVRLRVSAPGLLTLQREFPQLPSAPVELTPGLAVRGWVVDCNGQGVSGARLRFAGGEETTRDDGGFLFGVSAFPVQVRVESPGVQPGEFTLGESEGEGVTLKLPCQEGVELSLLSTEGPFHGEVVVAVRELGSADELVEERVSAMADPKGHLLLPLPRPGRFQLTLEPVGWAFQTLPPVEVTGGQRLHLGSVLLATGGGVVGTVMDSTGQPLGGVAVEAMPAGPEAYLAVRQGRREVAASDENGNFRLGGLSPGRYLVKWRAQGCASLWQLWDVPTGELVDVGVVHLTPGRALLGQVRNRQGKPVAAVEVRLRDGAAEYPEPLAVARGDGEGRFAFPPVAAGLYRLEAWKGSQLLVSQSWEHPAHEGVVLVPSGVELRGKLTVAGLAVPEASLTLTSWADAWTDRPIFQLDTPQGRLSWGGGGWTARSASGVDGSFLVEEVPPGPLVVSWAMPWGWLRRRVGVPDAERVEVVLEGAGEELQGRVVPAPGRFLYLSVFDPLGWPVAQAPVEADGSFRVGGLPVGPVVVEVPQGPGQRARVGVALPREEPLMVSLASGEGEGKPLVVRFRRQGQGVLGVQAVLLPEGSSHSLGARLATGEELLFPHVPPGRYRLLWADPLAGVGVARVEQTSFGREPLEVELPVGSSLTLRCSSCRGVALSELRLENAEGVDVTPLLSGFSLGLRFSPSGNLPLGRVAPGEWRVSWEAAGQRW